MTETMLEAALRYAALGWYVFPLRPENHPSNPKKDRKTPDPELVGDGGHTKATIDPVQIKAWWSTKPRAGIGVFMARSGLVAIDIDPKDDGHTKMAALEAVHGKLRSPVTALTGGRVAGKPLGQHRIFRAWEGMPKLPKNLGDGKGVDIKHPGYIVVEPSLHPDSGERYMWLPGYEPWDVAPSDIPLLPEWCCLNPGRSLAVRADNAQTDDYNPDALAGVRNPLGLTTAEMRSHLWHLPATEHEDWVEGLMAIHHETGGSEEGLELAHEWSEEKTQSNNYSAEDVEKRWRSFDADSDDGKTFRTIVKKANEAREAKSAAKLVGLKAEIISAVDIASLTATCDRIKPLELEPAVREGLVSLVLASFKRIEGVPIPRPEARRMLKYERELVPEGTLITPPWAQEIVFIENEDIFYAYDGTERTWSPAAFDRAHNKAIMTAQDKREGRTLPGVKPQDVALNVLGMKKVSARIYMPSEPALFRLGNKECVNTYSEHGVVEAKPESEWTAQERADVARINRHFSVLLPDDRDSALLKSWLAYPVQTKLKVGFTALLQSAEGAGKTFLAELMAAVLGEPNVMTVIARDVEDKFTGWSVGFLLVVVEELRMRGHNKFEGLNRIKTLVTNDTITVRRMQKDAVKAPNTANYLILSNFQDALPIKDTDRRHMVLFSQFQTEQQLLDFTRKEPEYFPELFKAKARSPAAIKGWFKSIKLHPDFHPRGKAPHTVHREGMIDWAKSDEHIRIEEILRKSRDVLLSKELLRFDKLQAALGDNLGLIPADRQIIDTLRDMGFQSLRQQTAAGEEGSFWSTTPGEFRRDGKTLPHLLTKFIRSNGL